MRKKEKTLRRHSTNGKISYKARTSCHKLSKFFSDSNEEEKKEERNIVL